MRVAILGIGRLGGSLVPLLERAGCVPLPWRRGEPMPAAADVYWITAREASVAEIAARLPPDAVALHAAGLHGPELLGERAERGVLHPLMTFPGPAVGLPDLRGAGARIDGTPRARAVASALGERLGMRPFVLEGDARAYHAAACLVSGHLGALFLTAGEVLARAGVAPAEAEAMLLPLARESLARAAAVGPDALTGPAARGDGQAEEEHRAALSPEERAVYEPLADRIRALRGRGTPRRD